MKPTGIVRHIDDLGRIVIPKEIRRALKIKDGDALEITTNYGGEIIIRPYKKSFEECAVDWFSSHGWEMNNCFFRIEGEYTFCITRFPQQTVSRAGYAKRYKGDAWDHRIGKVASYARAMGKDLNAMIGYEE